MNDRLHHQWMRSIWFSYLRRVTSIRFFCSVLFLLALACAITSGLGKFVSESGENITPWLMPILLDHKTFATYYGFIVCYMFSDVPFMNRTELYWILREGRKLWCLEKIAVIVMEAVTLALLAMLLPLCFFIPNIQFSWEWGKVIYSLGFSNYASVQYNIYVGSSTIVTRYTPLQAMLLCFGLVVLVSVFVGLLLFIISLYGNRLMAIAVGVALMTMQLMIYAAPTFGRFSYITPFYWCRLSTIGNYNMFGWYYPSLCYILLVSIIGGILCAFGIFRRTKHMEYVWNNEE